MHLRSGINSLKGFTILEMIAVIVITGLVAVSVVPAVARIDDAKKAAGAFDVARTIEFARARAAASGLPTGVRFDTALDTMLVVESESGGVAQAIVDALGEAAEPTDLGEQFGADVQRISLSTGAVSAGTIDRSTVWFTFALVPHLRNESGAYAGALDSDGLISFGSGAVVTVRAGSGLVEVTP